MKLFSKEVRAFGNMVLTKIEKSGWYGTYLKKTDSSTSLY